LGTSIHQRLNRAGPRESILLLALAGLAAWELAPFLAEGLPLRFDAHAHLARSWFAARGLAAGVIPGWANDWYGGFRLFEFYSPGYYLLSGTLGILLSDVIEATKWTLWVGQILAVVGFYLFLRRLFGNSLPAFFGAVLLLSGAQMRMALGVLGNHPSVLLFALLPLLLWHFVRCSEGWESESKPARRRAWLRLAAGQGLLLGAMGAAHLSNTFLLLPGILVFETLWLWPPRAQAAVRGEIGLTLAASLLIMTGLLCPLLLPALADLELVSLSLDAGSAFARIDLDAALTLAGLRDHSFERIFVRSHAWPWMIAGCGAGLLSLLPIPQASPAWQRTTRALLGGLLACFATVVLVDLRASLGAAFFLFALCVAALGPLTQLASRAGLPRAETWLPLAGIAFSLLWPENRHTPLPDYAPRDTFARYASLPATPLGGRTFDVSRSSISLDGFYGESSFSPYFSGRSIPFGGYPQASPLATNLSMALAGLWVDELLHPEPGAALSNEALDLLYLLHVEFLVDRDADDLLGRLEARPGAAVHTGPGIMRLQEASPALFSPRLQLPPARLLEHREASPRLMGIVEQQWAKAPLGTHRFPSLDALYRTAQRPGQDSALVELLRSMEIDRSRQTCSRIFTDRLLDPAAPPPSTAPEFEVLRHREEWSHVEIVARSATPGYLRLAYSDDPALRIELDGRPVAKAPDALTGAIVVAFPAGRHSLVLIPPRRSSAQRFALPVAVLAGASLFALIAAPPSRRPPPAREK